MSLGMMFVCLGFDENNSTGLLFIGSSVCISEVGFFLLSIAPSLSIALIANGISYIGQVFIPFFILMMMADICGVKINNATRATLIALGALMLLLTLTPGILPWYYEEVGIHFENGTTVLTKKHGLLYNAYFVYFGGYALAQPVLTLYSVFTGKFRRKRGTILLLLSSLVNTVTGITTEHLSQTKYEFLAISYVLTLSAIVVAYVLANRAAAKESEVPSLGSDADIEHILSDCEDIETLTEMERAVLAYLLLDYPRNDIARILQRPPKEVRATVSSIFGKLSVKDRRELFVKFSNKTDD